MAEKIRPNWRIADVASGDLDGPDLQGFLANPEMDLAPRPALEAPCLRACPLPSRSALIPMLTTNLEP